MVVGGGFVGVDRMTELEHFFPQMKLEIIDFLPRCLGSVSVGTADCCSEYMSASGIKEFWKKIEIPGGADDSYVCTGVKATNCFMPKKTLSEKGLDGGGWIVMNKYLQVETRDGPVWGDSVFFAVGECNYGSTGSPKISYPDEEQTTETLSVSLAAEIIEVPVIQTQEKTHVQHVVDTVEVEKSKIIEETVQRMNTIQEKISQVTKHIEVLQLQFLSKVVDMPVVGQRQASMVEKIQTTIEVPQAQVVEKTFEIPEIRTVRGTQTSESLGTARTRKQRSTVTRRVVRNSKRNSKSNSKNDNRSSRMQNSSIRSQQHQTRQWTGEHFRSSSRRTTRKQ